MAYFQQEAYADMNTRAAAYAGQDVRLAFLKRVYFNLLASAVVAAGGGAIGLLKWELFTNGWMWIGLVILEFIMLFVTFAVRKKEGINTFALYGFAFISGLTLAPLLTIAVHALGADKGTLLIGEALGLTLAVFGGLSLYALLSKKDFSFLGGALMIGLFLLIGAMIIGFFVGGFTYHLAYSIGGVLLFSGFVLYDTSRILRHYPPDEHIAATISLYLDFINLFVFILRILLLFAGSRD